MLDGKDASAFQPNFSKTVYFNTTVSSVKTVWSDVCRIGNGYQNSTILILLSGLQSGILCSAIVSYNKVTLGILNSCYIYNDTYGGIYPHIRVVQRDKELWFQCKFQQGTGPANISNNLSTINILSSNNEITLVDYLEEDTTEYTNSEIFAHACVADRAGASINIDSGEVIDWYGVQWSENSSSPTCTRIGNLELHKSLPIQNAMKGYLITKASDSYGNNIIVPLTENWQLQYSSYNNDVSDIDNDWACDIMVKIPEFWYNDDYVASTKQHNLKISQTAKAGWKHHKEAYVGAYEGYLNTEEGRYMSIKDEIPTVSVTRETIRTAARANGYDDEYKWNIYTYEEHRAICHLFLVEYATRNSQLAVNNNLTSEGFKQGGLGSGCTTGYVTINGVTTYSFIPTGTTDSLGNGSGEVAYTVTQTDSSGNETTSVTRYANRYRGIENPFGHIWKHTDDVITQIAISGYRTVYKCEDPSQFTTNRNSKYKPMCSFPSNLVGYKKEIKATVNCDFFPMTVGGSDTTYWCDYTYDNADTTQHCLLLGGRSVDGGSAGLFNLDMAGGVGNSSASVGSRLTYLPWAE